MKRIFVLFFLTFSALPFSSGAAAPEGARLIVHLLDYLAQDYSGAVARGKVLDESEYKEQVEFVRIVVDAEKKLPAEHTKPPIHEGLVQLQSLISQKADPREVSALARKIQSDLIQVSGLSITPTQWPDLVRAKDLYAQNCAACHGDDGRGNGPASQGLDPKPANFHDSERMEPFTPLKGFNTIRIGIPGTAMTSFANFSDQEVWDLAFYVASFRHSLPRKGSQSVAVQSDLFEKNSLKTLAISSDEDLWRLNKNGNNLQEKEGVLSALRNLPPKKSQSDFSTARLSLQKALEEKKAGRIAEAKHEALKAYLEGVEPLEAPLRGKDATLVIEIEQKMAQLRTFLEGDKSYEEAAGTVKELDRLFERGEDLLAQRSSPWFIFLMAASILLREGFEAILIIVAILGVLRALKQKKAVLWVHGGWIVALLTGFLLWVASTWLIRLSGAQREVMEGMTSLLAVAVLLYVGFWLHNKTEIHRWTAFIDGRTREALAAGNLASLAFISFAAVFREAFETVLFLQALSLEGSGSTPALAGGVGVSLLLIFLLAVLLLKFSVRIPIRKLFNLSSMLMAALSVVLAGKGVHSLQEMGWVSTTHFPLPFRVDLLGLFPTLETLGAQAAVLLVSVLLWVAGKRPSSFGSAAANTAEI